jgi:fructokinase
VEDRVILGGLEGGGTKFECLVGSGPDGVRATATIPTTTPGETLEAVAAFFDDHAIDGLGVATFGPIDLDRSSPRYGHLIGTPKPGWEGTDVAGILATRLGVPVTIDTDVNGAAVGEGRWGAGRGLDTFLYLTVGTGVGGGGLIDGMPMHGMMHPEMGHIRIPRHPDDDFTGNCPYHGDCLEGLAAGPAIAERWGKPAEDLGTDVEAARSLEAYYLGTALSVVALVVSPERIIVGGGVLGMPGLLEATRAAMRQALGEYLDPRLGEVADFVVAPGLGSRSGVFGALAMAETGSTRR